MESFGEDLTLGFERPTEKQIECALFIARNLGLEYDARYFTKQETSQFISENINKSKEVYAKQCSYRSSSRPSQTEPSEEAKEEYNQYAYEAHLSHMAFSMAEDGEHGAGISMRYSNLKSSLSYEDFKQGKRICTRDVWEIY